MESFSFFSEIDFASFLFQGFFAVVLFVVGWMVSGLLRRFMFKMLSSAKVDPSVVGFVTTASVYAFRAFLLIAVLAQLGINTTSLAAAVGAAGLAIGFALRNTLSNVAAGILLVSLRSFKIGDFVEAAGKSGTVKGITIFHTLLKQGDGSEVTLPNNSVFSGSITNLSHNPQRRCEIVLPLSYDSDLEQAKMAIMRAIDANTTLLKESGTTIVVKDLSDDGMTLMVRVWFPTKNLSSGKFALMEEIYAELKKVGVRFRERSRL